MLLRTAEGLALMVNVFTAVTEEQFALPVAVRVNSTLPAEISAAPGLYVAAVSEFALSMCLFH